MSQKTVIGKIISQPLPKQTWPEDGMQVFYTGNDKRIKTKIDEILTSGEKYVELGNWGGSPRIEVPIKLLKVMVVKYHTYPVPQKDGLETKYEDGTRLWGGWGTRLEEWRDKGLAEKFEYMPLRLSQWGAAKEVVDTEREFQFEITDIDAAAIPPTKDKPVYSNEQKEYARIWFERGVGREEIDFETVWDRVKTDETNNFTKKV